MTHSPSKDTVQSGLTDKLKLTDSIYCMADQLKIVSRQQKPTLVHPSGICKSKPCIISRPVTKVSAGLNVTPETEKDCAGVLTHLVVWHNVGKLPAYIANMLQHRVALLTFVHKDSIRVDL